MRGEVNRQGAMFSTVSPERRVPGDHPIRRIKAMADAQLAALSPVFDSMYGTRGRPSIPPETLLKSCLLIVLFSVRSERQFCERLDYDLMFRYFLDMGLDDDAFDASSFAKNKERLLEADVARQFFDGIVRQAKGSGLISSEHFTVDGTLVEAWAALKTFRPRGEKGKKQPPPDDPGNPTVNFHGQKRSNATHVSTTDPESRLAKKGDGVGAKLSYSAHVLMENRHGLCADIAVVTAAGDSEWVGAEAMLDRVRELGIRPRTLGADKGYDVRRFRDALRSRGITPHVAQHTNNRRSSIDARTTRHPGYRISQRCRKKVEEIFGWMKTVGNWRKTRYRGVARNAHWAYLEAAAYNLTRMVRLMPA
jgi:transposase